MGFSCCEISLQTKEAFAEHQASFHFPTSTFKNDHFKCPLCQSKLNLLKNYKKHLIKFHPKEVCGIFDEAFPTVPQPAQHPRPVFNPFEVRTNVNPIEVVHQNVAQSNFYEADDFELAELSDEPMGSGDDQEEYGPDDIPYFEKESQPEQSDITNEHQILVAFAKLLISLKYGLNVAYKHLSQIVVAVLTFIFILMSKKVLTAALLVEMKRIAGSRHLQDKYSDSLKLAKHPDKNFYYTDLSEVIQRYLSHPVICQQLFYELKRK